MITTRRQRYGTLRARVGLLTLLLTLSACGGVSDPDPGQVTVSPGSSVIAVGEAIQLTAVVVGASIANPEITWRSADPAVASVDANGLVTGVAGGTAAIIAEAEGTEGAASIEVLQPLSVVSLSVDTTASQLVHRLTVQLSGPAALEIDYATPTASPLRVVSPDVEASHDVLLPRLLADATYSVTVTPVGPSSLRGTPDTAGFTTRPLPPGLAAFGFTASGQMTTPLNMLELRSTDWSGTAMIDNEGRIVWWWEGLGRTNGVTRRANGNFVFLDFASPTRLVEVTPDGREVHQLFDNPGVADIIHHDVTATPQNTVLFLARDTQRTVNDTIWTGDRIVEWDPDTGTVTGRWDMFDFYSILDDRGPRSGTSNFAAANSLAIGASGNYIVSLRNLDQVISIAPDFQSVDWRLGGPGSDFTLTLDDTFFFQHSATQVSDGNVLLFDNGGPRPVPVVFSRVMEYSLNAATGEASSVFEFRLSPDEFSRMVSSARRLSNGNTVALFGGDTMSPKKAFEVTPGGTVIWSMEITGASTINRANPFSDVAGEIEIAGP